jgi:hypothetical protein
MMAAGCSTFKPVTGIAPEEAIEQQEPKVILIKTVDGRKFTLQEPMVFDGVVHGTTYGQRNSRERVHIPVDSIDVLEVKKTDAGWSVVGVLFGVLAVAAVAAVVAAANCCGY